MKPKTKPKSKKSFEEIVRGMSAKQLIMAMVNGLKKPKLKVDMGTFGRTTEGACYGCAATNAICEISGVKFTPETIYSINAQSEFVGCSEVFLSFLEPAYDHLRCNGVLEFNILKPEGVAALREKPGLNLPYLDNNYTTADLKPYIELAEYQEA